MPIVTHGDRTFILIHADDQDDQAAMHLYLTKHNVPEALWPVPRPAGSVPVALLDGPATHRLTRRGTIVAIKPPRTRRRVDRGGD